MYKACGKCGKIHDYNKKCYVGDTFRKKNTNANNFRSTSEWKYKSEEIRENSKFLCSICKEQGIYTYNTLEVHHIEPVEENYDRRLDNYNLICLCNAHHREAEIGNIKRDFLFELAKKREEEKVVPPIL